jgi:hypothetical protein
MVIFILLAFATVGLRLAEEIVRDLATHVPGDGYALCKDLPAHPSVETHYDIAGRFLARNVGGHEGVEGLAVCHRVRQLVQQHSGHGGPGPRQPGEDDVAITHSTRHGNNGRPHSPYQGQNSTNMPRFPFVSQVDSSRSNDLL